MANAGMMPDIQGENEKELDISEWIPSLSSLEKKLQSAIEDEKYELAAKIRDQIKDLHT